MIFGKKKRMIDVGELQRKGVVRPPKKDEVIPTNSEGFVDLRTSVGSPSTKKDFFYSKPSSSSSNNFSTETDGYNKAEVDQKIVDLDNKIYKLEQRIELLERKAGVGSQDNYSTGIQW